MGRRYVILGILLGFGAASLLGLAALPGCYDVPQPVCGFRCGPDNACPEDYTCSVAEQVCRLDGSDPTEECRRFLIDARTDDDDDEPADGPDLPPPDGSIDAPPDAPPDAPIDAPPDAD